jgi:hypothetical protein
MRRVEFKAWIIFDEEKSIFGEDMVSSVKSELANLEGVSEWEFTEISNEEVENE